MSENINVELLKVFGVDTERCISANIEMQPGKTILIVRYEYFDKDVCLDGVMREVKRYKLVEDNGWSI